MTSKQLIATIATAGTLLTGGVLNNIQLEAQDQAINPYIETVDKLEANVKGNKVTVHKNAPKITLEKWNGKDSLGVSYSKTKKNGKTERKQLTKIAEYQVDNKESVVMNPTEDGFEIDILLNSKPTSNVFTYTFENWQDKDFFYQPELTPQEIAEGASRPENVVGSYAVYSKEKKDHILGQTNYETGKLFHIYRPLVSDSNDSTTWGTLNIVDGVMTVTVPQEFLNNASYPVLVDPTFGYTTVGATQVTWPNGNNSVSQFNLSINDVVVTKLTTYWAGAGNCGNPVYGVIYNDNGSNAPNALLGVTNGLLSAQQTDGWNDLTFPSPFRIVSSGNYWLGVTNAIACLPGRGDVAGNNAFTADTPPPDDPFGTPSSSSYRKSIYATYSYPPLILYIR